MHTVPLTTSFVWDQPNVIHIRAVVWATQPHRRGRDHPRLSCVSIARVSARVMFAGLCYLFAVHLSVHYRVLDPYVPGPTVTLIKNRYIFTFDSLYMLHLIDFIPNKE